MLQILFYYISTEKSLQTTLIHYFKHNINIEHLYSPDIW